MEGKVVTEEEMLEGTAWAWVEVHSFKSLPRTHLANGFKLQGMGYQFAENHAYGHGTFGNRYHEVRNSHVLRDWPIFSNYSHGYGIRSSVCHPLPKLPCPSRFRPPWPEEEASLLICRVLEFIPSYPIPSLLEAQLNPANFAGAVLQRSRASSSRDLHHLIPIIVAQCP
jgi:hypothetical protein